MTTSHPAEETIVPDGIAADAVLLQIPVTHWPADLINANQVARHSVGKWRRTKAWRTAAAWLAIAKKLQPIAPPVRVDVWFRFPNNRRRDTGNLQPTCKAIVDGLGDRDNDAGVLPGGDHDGALDGPHARRYYPNGPEHIVVVLTPLRGQP